MLSTFVEMSNQYILPVVDHLLEEEVDAELRLRNESVDRRETLDDKRRLLRRLFKDDRVSGTGYKGTHKYSEELKVVSETVNELIESLRKSADRAQVSRLRHYLILLASASVVGKEEEIAQNGVCSQIEGVLRELGLKIRGEEEVDEEEDVRGTDKKKVSDSKHEDKKGIMRNTKSMCVSGSKAAYCDCAWCEGKGARKKDSDKRSDEMKRWKQNRFSEEEWFSDRKADKGRTEQEKKQPGNEKYRYTKDDRKSDKDDGQIRKTTRKSHHIYGSTDGSSTEVEDNRISRNDKRNARRKHRQFDSSESKYDYDSGRRRRDSRDRRTGGNGRRHRRRSRSSSRQSSDSGRHRYRKSRVENWNLYFAGDSRSMQVEDFLYKIKKLARHEGVSDGELLRNIHHRLKGEVYDWWFTREDRFTTWSKFEDEIRFRYDNPNRDRRIMAQIRDLKQRRGETLIAFLTEVEKLNQCLQRPFSSETLFELVWENMRPHYRSRLSIMDIYDFEQLIRVNHKIDASDPNFYKSPTSGRGDVNHLEAEESYDEEQEDINVPVQLIQRTQRDSRQALPVRSQQNPTSSQRPDQQRPTSIVSCWNCQRPGHIWRNCTESKIIFCYACGKVGRTTRTCENNHSRMA